MPIGAPRKPLVLWQRLARGAMAAWCLCLPEVAAAEIASARYDDPTTRYAHGVLGDAIEYGTLVMTLKDGRVLRAILPKHLVFEDLEPRVYDLDLDGDLEIIVVESSNTLGGRLAIYDESGRIATTPHIGRSNRWLAPVGASDLDGDGVVEIAYVDRPHLAKTLRIWRFQDNALNHVADVPGVTNHRIGWDFIPGGIRDCGQGPEIILADTGWSRMVGITHSEQGYAKTDLGRLSEPRELDRALDCP